MAYNPAHIKTGLSTLWGWRQHYDVEEFTIADSLTQSDSGQYYQDVHPLMSLDNVKAIAPNFNLIQYPEWDESTQYRVDDRVSDNTGNYRAKLANSGLTPETHAEQWERFDPFSEWLEQKTQASILKAVSTMWDQKLSDKTAKNILESKALFNGAGRISDTIENQGNIVGFEIVPIRSNSARLRIDKIGLQMTGQGEVKLYLMHSSRLDPVKTITLNRIRNAGMQWFAQSDLYLPYISDDNDAGGSWYLVYRQDELPENTNAIKKSKDWSARPCGSCDYAELANWNVWSKYLEVHPFKTADQPSGDFNDDFNDDFSNIDLPLWDISTNLYDYNTNYGINLQITIECDMTNLILEQKNTFLNMIGLQVAADMLREMAYNPSFNIGRQQQNLQRESILYELDGDSRGTGKSGLYYQLEKAMDAVKIDLSSADRVCFPCKNGGLKYRTV